MKKGYRLPKRVKTLEDLLVIDSVKDMLRLLEENKESIVSMMVITVDDKNNLAYANNLGRDEDALVYLERTKYIILRGLDERDRPEESGDGDNCQPENPETGP
jgi:hypothetical protein